MATDFSRVRSNPLLDYAGVQLKQGSVLLDADANELTAILDRRLRALASDVLGRATVGANTPEAFRISLNGNAGLDIGRGRLYVDGLLAENHGAADPSQREFDALLGETRYAQPVSYDAQPYLPSPPALPRAGRHVVYLDTWQREVTHLEQPNLVESAVGVETGSRLQTVWQVRVLDEAAGTGVNCGSSDAELGEQWNRIVAPSSARLTTGTYEVAAVADPCELPPSGGYRGLENQLYRVEIHEGGDSTGGPTFKWSRENASVGSRVATMVSETVLELDSLGRDDVLSIHKDDWIEVRDDVREVAQVAGEMRRVAEVDRTNNRVTLTVALPAAMLPGAFPDSVFPVARNTRVILWNQRGRVLSTAGNGTTSVFQDLDATTSTGAIRVPAVGTTLLLENGVTVSFSSVGADRFRAGDHWVFAARTGDASVEKLDTAPPRGIHHHYARLAIWDAGSNAEPTDCRHSWPPRGGADCACTQCVHAEDHNSGAFTIDDAIRRVQETGGTVCLQPGVYNIRVPIRLTNARSVRVHGQGAATVLNASSGAFSIESGMGLALDSMSMITSGKSPAISVRSALGLALHDLVILVANPQAEASAIGLSGAIAGLTIRDNLIVAPLGIKALDPTAPEPMPLLSTLAVRIEDNIFWCTRHAIDFAGRVSHLFSTQIKSNEVVGSRDGGISMLGVGLMGASMRISDNSLNVNGPGIRCASEGVWIEGNKVSASAQNDRQPTGSGITLETGINPDGIDHCQILSNQVSGFPDAGILINAPFRDLICKLNIIDRCGNGIVVTAVGGGGAASIENNHLTDIGHARARPELGPFIHGISVQRLERANVVGNTIRRVGLQAVRGIDSVAGIVHFAVRRSRIAGNSVLEVGPETAVPGLTLSGLMLQGPYTDNEISNNVVERDGAAASADGASWSAIRSLEPGVSRPVVHAGNFTSVHLTAARMLVVNATHAFTVDSLLDFTDAAAPAPRRSSATVRGNAFQSRGAASAIEIENGADIHFADNRCQSVGPAAAVSLSAPAAIVSSNIVRGGGDIAISLSVPADRAVILGNATRGQIFVSQKPVGSTQWANFNVGVD